MRIAVIGTGYVGLVAGTCFADAGHQVTCVDIDAAKIAALERGEVPFYEPGLGELIEKNAREQRLAFSVDLAEGVRGAAAVFIAVGTPGLSNGEAEVRPVLEVARAVGQALTGYAVVVNKSTVPVGTADRVRAAVAQHASHPFDVVSNPEFLKEGAAVGDFLKPDRVVIGADSERAKQVMEELYLPFLRREARILFMDPRSAELTKYAANAMLATRISFMNDMAALCERLGADVEQVRQGLGSDSRIGSEFLYPGLGYGGSCFPKDVRALLATGREVGLELGLLAAVEATNERQKKSLVEKALKHFGSLAGRRFAVWGLSFKPRTDDLRDAPALALIDALLSHGAQVSAFDPVASGGAKKLYGARISFAALPYDALEGADALFLATEWNEFRAPDFARMKTLLKSPVIFDGRNVYAPARLREAGFTWYGVGRP
ncbi:MAG: UDP-glucose/GDP-mannose dehydrogenase family protein [Myxococcales bacterium]|nr:UDP-glucose/GDP-mannose dehydrogenase family protein [Myxococcales bacterium]